MQTRCREESRRAPVRAVEKSYKGTKSIRNFKCGTTKLLSVREFAAASVPGSPDIAAPHPGNSRPAPHRRASRSSDSAYLSQLRSVRFRFVSPIHYFIYLARRNARKEQGAAPRTPARPQARQPGPLAGNRGPAGSGRTPGAATAVYPLAGVPNMPLSGAFRRIQQTFCVIKITQSDFLIKKSAQNLRGGDFLYLCIVRVLRWSSDTGMKTQLTSFGSTARPQVGRCLFMPAGPKCRYPAGLEKTTSGRCLDAAHGAGADPVSAINRNNIIRTGGKNSTMQVARYPRRRCPYIAVRTDFRQGSRLTVAVARSRRK